MDVNIFEQDLKIVEANIPSIINSHARSSGVSPFKPKKAVTRGATCHPWRGSPKEVCELGLNNCCLVPGGIDFGVEKPLPKGYKVMAYMIQSRTRRWECSRNRSCVRWWINVERIVEVGGVYGWVQDAAPW